MASLVLVHHVESVIKINRLVFDGVECPAYIIKEPILQTLFDWMHALGGTPLCFC